MMILPPTKKTGTHLSDPHVLLLLYHPHDYENLRFEILIYDLRSLNLLPHAPAMLCLLRIRLSPSADQRANRP